METSDLRIALFSGNYNYVRDGANQALNRLTGRLLERGAAVRIYSPTTSTPAFEPVGDLVSVPSIPFPFGRNEYRLALGMNRAMRTDIESFKPQLVHVSSPDFLNHAAIRWARHNGIKTVASLHTRFDTYPAYYKMDFLEKPLQAMQRHFYNRVDHVLAPGDSLIHMLHSWGVTSPCSHWLRGTDHRLFNPGKRSESWRAQLSIKPDDIVVGFLGRLVLEKGLDLFAKVAVELENRNLPHRIIVIGEGPARRWFEEKVPNAIFAGFQSGEALGRAIASMDIFFNPSVTECFSNVDLEAMASGVPIVGADAIGQIGIVESGKAGFLVPPRSISAYADAIENLILKPDLRRAFGKAGYEKAATYDWNSVNDKAIDTYLDLLA